MSSTQLLTILRSCGTEATVLGVLRCNGTGGLCTSDELLSRLVAMLERKKLLRRGHILELLNGVRTDEPSNGNPT